MYQHDAHQGASGAAGVRTRHQVDPWAESRVSERVVSRKAQHGLFDSNILCADCDGYLNTRYDGSGEE
jgi:hypothetical protein